MDVDAVVVVVNGAIRALGAISAPDGVIGTPGVISTPEDMVAINEEILGVRRGGDAGAVTRRERERERERDRRYPPEIQNIYMV